MLRSGAKVKCPILVIRVVWANSWISTNRSVKRQSSHLPASWANFVPRRRAFQRKFLSFWADFSGFVSSGKRRLARETVELGASASMGAGVRLQIENCKFQIAEEETPAHAEAHSARTRETGFHHNDTKAQRIGGKASGREAEASGAGIEPRTPNIRRRTREGRADCYARFRRYQSRARSSPSSTLHAGW